MMFGKDKVKRKAKIRIRYKQIQHLTQATIKEIDKKHNAQESQNVSLVPAGDDKAARNRQGSIKKTNMQYKGLNMFHKFNCSHE